MNQGGQDGVENQIELLAEIFGEESQDEISVLLQQGILLPVLPVGFGIRQMLRAI